MGNIILNGTNYAGGGGGGGSVVFRIVITGQTGETVTATQGATTYTATEQSTGVYVVDVDAVGTWTISNGVDSTTVDVGVYNTTLASIPDGKTVTPTDDVSILLACGGRSEAYTTINEVLADSTCLTALILDNNAVDYLVRSTTWATTVCADMSAMSIIGLDNYASNTLLDNSTWRAAICTSAYFESVLNVKVPRMTSNTAPSGVVSAKNSYSASFAPWKAFNDVQAYGWSPTINNNSWIQYDFTRDVTIYMVDYKGMDYVPPQNAKVQYSDDNSTFVDVTTLPDPPSSTSNVLTHIFKGTSHRYWRIDGNNANNDGYKFQFYGREDV